MKPDDIQKDKKNLPISEADAPPIRWSEEEEDETKICEGDPLTFPRAKGTKSGPAIMDRLEHGLHILTWSSTDTEVSVQMGGTRTHEDRSTSGSGSFMPTHSAEGSNWKISAIAGSKPPQRSPLPSTKLPVGVWNSPQTTSSRLHRGMLGVYANEPT